MQDCTTSTTNATSVMPGRRQHTSRSARNMPASRTIFALVALLAIFAPLTAGHSWVEEYQVISSNGSFVGDRGYSRGYVSREEPTYNGFSMMWMLPSLEARNTDGTVRNRINSSDFLCHPAQRTSNYTTTYPKLKVQPGDYVAMKYLENGHVTLPWNITGKPPGTGTVFIFGTTNASDSERIADVMEWNKDGSGGNKRGFLMTAQNFDDGRCHQLNCGSISQQRQMLTPNHVADQPTSTVESWCETDLKIPENTKSGTLTTYWVWQWPTEPNMDCNTPAGKDEYYTTCADFDVVAADDSSAGTASVNEKLALAPFSAAVGANPQSVAVSDFKSRTAIQPTPTAVVVQANKKIVGYVASVDSSFVKTCSQQASVISANTLTLWPEVYVPNACSVVTSFGTAAATAAAAAFEKAASSYSSGYSSAWAAAFKAANLPQPTPIPWSQIPSADFAPTGSATATAAPIYSSPATIMSATQSSSSATSSPDVQVTTITQVVVITSTLPPGVPVPTTTSSEASSAPAYFSSSETSSSSSSAASSAPAYASSLTTSSTSSDIASSSVAGGYMFSTILTVSGSSTTKGTPKTSTSSSSSTSASPSESNANAPIVPSIGTNGTVYRRLERRHPRNFSH